MQYILFPSSIEQAYRQLLQEGRAMLTEQERQELKELLARERKGEPLTEKEKQRLIEFWDKDDGSAHYEYCQLDGVSAERLRSLIAVARGDIAEARVVIKAAQRRLNVLQLATS
jgi:hypothetical protein